MSTAFLIYLVMQLDGVNTALTVMMFATSLTLFGAVALNVIYMIEGWDSDKDKKVIERVARVIKKSTVAIVILAVMATLTPTTQTAIYMIGGSATVEALQSDEAKEIGGKVLDLLQKKLDEELEK